MEEKQFIIGGHVLQALLVYLENKPYKETAALISLLMDSKEATVVDANAGTSS